MLQEFRPEGIWQALYEEYLELLEKKRIPAPDADIAAALAEKGLVALSPDRTLSDQLNGQSFTRKETEAVSPGGF